MGDDNQNQSSLSSFADANASSGMETYRETAVAFDNLIVQVGRAIADAQESMVLSQVNLQRQVVRALKEGRLRHLDVPPMNAYAMPETTLNLKMGLSIDYSEESSGPALSAVPLNATTTNQNDIDIESATEIKLRFVSVPQTQEPPGPAPGLLTPEEVEEIMGKDESLSPLLEELETLTKEILYQEDSRLWLMTYLEAREPRLVIVVDDRTSNVIAIIDGKLPPTDDELAPIGAPLFETVEPASGKQGEILTIHGDNFLTLAGQTILGIDGKPVPIVRFTMKAISFKVPGWATEGNVEIITPLGKTVRTNAFTPVPTIDRFEPKYGAFNALRQQGAWFSVFGHNLRHGCAIQFATGVVGQNVRVVSPGQIKVEVPQDAGSGPLTLVFREFRQSLAEVFFMLPRIHKVVPRQARVGETVTLQGNSLGDVSHAKVGEAIIPASQFTLHTPTQIRFTLPPDASDGHIYPRETITGSDQFSETKSRDIFYVVPRITGFGSTVGIPGNLLTIYGEGLDPEPDMMSLIFEARTGISEAPVLSVSRDRRSLTTRVPMDAATGYILLLRKRVYSDSSPIDTSDLSMNKLAILTIDGHPTDLILDERFDTETPDPSRWLAEAGTWAIDRGTLSSGEDTGRLTFANPLDLDRFSIYADIFNARRFGFSIVAKGGSLHLQVWVDLVGNQTNPPALTWSMMGDKNSLAGTPLALLPGQNHLVQLNVQKIDIDGKQLLELTLLLDQEPVHTYHWDRQSIGTISLLADSPEQRWDNAVILKGNYLSLPQPDLYRFGAIPELPQLPALKVDSFEPLKGGPGTEVVFKGEGLDDAARFLFGGAEAGVIRAEGTTAAVNVPSNARSGPIEVQGRGGITITTGEQRFTVPPRITGFVPEQVLTGRELRILGTNLPVESGTFSVTLLDRPAQVVAAAPTMLSVIVPEVTGEGKVSLSYEGFDADAPSLVKVRRETLLMDMVERSEHAVWTSAGGPVSFGVLSEETTGPSVQMRSSERLEDDRTYGPVLYVHPPVPSLRALWGTYPEVEIPEGRIELRIQTGMLFSSAPTARDAADVDGVMFEVRFKVSRTGEEIILLERTACVFDGSLERFVVDAGSIAGQKGQPVISVFAGRTGLRDDAAVVSCKLVQLV
ncbi:MAG: hypothetical protein GY940_32815 [bacterium]|nr:hypothetical protein [bacterium]